MDADPGPPPAPAAFARPPATDVGLLAVVIVAVSTSGPLITATAAPALAIAFWRNALASGAITPVAVLRCRRELARLARREWILCLGAGVLLAGHFAAWVPSLRYTNVASATALVATQPVWAVLIARLRGHDVPRWTWVGTGLAVVGAALLTGVDVEVSARALTGDLLALAGAVLAACYVTAGGEARRSVSTTSYTAICYATAAVVLLVGCLGGGVPLTGYPAFAWLGLLALTVGPQLLGHSTMNRVLRTTSASVVSLAILLEVPGATLLAWVFLGQHPAPAALPAVALLLSGIALVVAAGSPAGSGPVEPGVSSPPAELACPAPAGTAALAQNVPGGAPAAPRGLAAGPPGRGSPTPPAV